MHLEAVLLSNSAPREVDQPRELIVQTNGCPSRPAVVVEMTDEAEIGGFKVTVLCSPRSGQLSGLS